ncbi:hypothetical protein [Krasilnikovia cinnamomea]|uniref:hypothetical protein n=1 Tax=Krasilnikovia cinnamomea TaxID=349313 RepID=UPI001F5E9662|nr:hypothetical protein [Krasilnikovia cinnamomea]
MVDDQKVGGLSADRAASCVEVDKSPGSRRLGGGIAADMRPKAVSGEEWAEGRFAEQLRDRPTPARRLLSASQLDGLHE